MSEDKVLTLNQRCRALAEECRSKARPFRNDKPRIQIFELAAEYRRKANLAETLEIRTQYDPDIPLIPESSETFVHSSSIQISYLSSKDKGT